MSDEAEAAPEDTTGRGESLTLGARLRDARQSRELSIEKIADELRIDEHVLVALEEDRLADIKVAPVFIKGYIKQYGRLLQLDYDELRQAFYAQIDTDDVTLRPNSSIQLRDERQITLWIIAALAVLLVGIALFLWWLGTEDVNVSEILGDTPQTPAPALLEAPVADEPQPQPDPDPLAARAVNPAAADTGAAGGAAPAPGDAAAAPAERGAAVTTEPEQGADGASLAAAAASEPAAALVQDAAPEPGSVPMAFAFSQESWFELDDASGRRLHYDLAAAGRELRFVALPPVRVLIGNAAAVSIRVDSEPFAIPAGSLRGNVANFVIDPAQD
ncbi:MAG TPA: RodZ domain-containing protein [Gammaproteobacteria bacterium]|nr:RodZ domain-containing protein [Gammaproteobacteria bacterium]